MSSEGKVALVTGAGSGIGKAAAIALAREGVRVGVLDFEPADIDQVVGEIEQSGGQALHLCADVSNAQQMQAAITQLAGKFGRIDFVFANAGINGVWAPLEDLTPDEWDKTLAVNLKGTFLSIKYAAPWLKKQGGSCVVTSSVNGTRIFSNTGASAYSSSKAAQVALTKMLALELAEHRVRVNVICPGAIETNIDENTEARNIDQIGVPVEYPESSLPLSGGRPGSAEQVAQLVLFLMSDASDHITGTEIWIDGAQSLIEG